MPLPLAAAVAGANLAGGILGAGAQQRANADNQRYNMEMYLRQRKDALEFWNMQNEYNSPQAQMQRYKDAGLNPNLIYGQGSSGNAGAISSPDVQPFQSRPVDFGSGLVGAAQSFINSFYDTDIKQAQLDNLKAQNNVIRQDALLKAAQTSNTLQGTEKSIFDLNYSKELFAVNAEFRREQLRKLKADIDYTTHEDARKAASNSTSIAEALERMKNLKLERTYKRADIVRINAAVDNMSKDAQLKQLDIDLRKQGINPNDPMWARILGRVLDSLYGRYFE